MLGDFPSQEDFGRWLFTQRCDFVLGVSQLEQLPEATMPEIAFAGRSNVGKSSIINALLNHQGLARTSNTPGRTQQLNFFNLNDLMYLVDLPGFGFAKAPKSIVEQWQGVIKNYLSGRPTLERIYLLIDARHGIMKVDREHMDLFDESALSYQIVLTKVDKISKNELEKTAQRVHTEITLRPAAHPEILQTSSHKGLGLETFRAEISKFIKVYQEQAHGTGN